MKTKKYIVAIIAVLVVATAIALTGCASMQGAWAQIGINADKITSVTLVRSSGVASVLKPLEGQEMTDFIAAFDAIELRIPHRRTGHRGGRLHRHKTRVLLPLGRANDRTDSNDNGIVLLTAQAGR